MEELNFDINKNISCPTCGITPLLKYVDDKIIYECLNFDKNHQNYEGIQNIDTFLLKPKQESYRCKEHKKPFIKFCKKCKKNLCIWCTEHNEHKEELVSFNDIFPKKNDIIIYKEQINKMKKSLKDIDRFSEKILNIGKKIINWVTNEKEKIELFKKNIGFHIKFNEYIIDSLNYDQMNYYSLLNFQNLNFDLEEKDKLYSKVKIKELFYLTHDLELNYENYNIQKNIHLNFLNDKSRMNMWISNNYCPKWGLKEGIREFLQNQYDAIILKITKKNLCVIPCGETYTFNDFDTYINYSFENISENNKKYGEYIMTPRIIY